MARTVTSRVQNAQESLMQLFFWMADGLLAGWLTGKVMSSEGRDHVMDVMAGISGGMAGGLIVAAARLPFQGKIILANVAALAGAVIMTFLTRVIRGKRE